jgi:large subunit ribosomal protein L21
MFAVLKTGGKQYRVSPKDIIEVEKLESEIGATIVLNDVVLFNDGTNTQIGTPNVDGIAVSAEVINQKKGEKVIIFKKKRRHNYRRTRGHRQNITVLKISEIGKELTAKAAPKKAENADKAETAPKKATAKKAEAKAETAKTPAKAKEASAKKTTKTTKASKSE